MSFTVSTIPTKPFAGQKPGTSGLRKRVTEVSQAHYFNNFIQASFAVLVQRKQLAYDGSIPCTLIVGGDGRYWNKEAIQIIISMAAANGVTELIIGEHGIFSTPAVSAEIRHRKSTGAIILTASHNPGGPQADFGIKYNTENGGPAPEKVTEAIYKETTQIQSYRIANEIQLVPLTPIGKVHEWTRGGEDEGKGRKFTVRIIDPVANYLDLMKRCFDFPLLKKFIAREDFKMKLDSLSGVTGTYSQRIFGPDELGPGKESGALLNCEPSEDFNGGHPDPNLTYAHVLVKIMEDGDFDFGAAWDGDGDRNMILGRKAFFVNPSDSLPIIADFAAKGTFPQFKKLSAVCRSMPTGAAIDLVAKKRNLAFYEVPTGWKFFGNVMDHYEKKEGGVICGEESFGTGSDHIREKDGTWAILAWLSILANENKDRPIGKLKGVQEICEDHWKEFGRHFFSRWDFEECDSDAANKMMKHLEELIAGFKKGDESVKSKMESDQFKLAEADDFEYKDQFDESVSSHQGLRFLFTDGSRAIFRLSGTGSTGATIRLYVEMYENDRSKVNAATQTALKNLIDLSLKFSNLREFVNRQDPTVIT